MKKILIISVCWFCFLGKIQAQNAIIQYDAKTKKGYIRKEIVVQFGDSIDIKKKAVAWATKTIKADRLEYGAMWDMYIKGAGVYPGGFDLGSKKETLSYNFNIEIKKGLCIITFVNLINRDQILFNDIERHAFKDDGTRRTNLARVTTVESVERSINEVIKSLEKALKGW